MADQISLTLWDKLIISFFGNKKVGWKKDPDWKGYLEVYAFKCPKHGYVFNHVHGGRTLDCPEYFKEIKEQ